MDTMQLASFSHQFTWGELITVALKTKVRIQTWQWTKNVDQSVFSLCVEDLGARIWLFGSLPEEKWTLFDLKTCCCSPLLYLCTLGFKMNLYIWEKSFSYLQVPHFILKWLEGRRVPAAQRRNVTFTETHMLTSHAVIPG